MSYPRTRMFVVLLVVFVNLFESEAIVFDGLSQAIVLEEMNNWDRDAYCGADMNEKNERVRPTPVNGPTSTTPWPEVKDINEYVRCVLARKCLDNLLRGTPEKDRTVPLSFTLPEGRNTMAGFPKSGDTFPANFTFPIRGIVDLFPAKPPSTAFIVFAIFWASGFLAMMLVGFFCVAYHANKTEKEEDTDAQRNVHLPWKGNPQDAV